jgi:hypothetical protein
MQPGGHGCTVLWIDVAEKYLSEGSTNAASLRNGYKGAAIDYLLGVSDVGAAGSTKKVDIGGPRATRPGELAAHRSADIDVSTKPEMLLPGPVPDLYDRKPVVVDVHGSSFAM